MDQETFFDFNCTKSHGSLFLQGIEQDALVALFLQEIAFSSKGGSFLVL